MNERYVKGIRFGAILHQDCQFTINLPLYFYKYMAQTTSMQPFPVLYDYVVEYINTRIDTITEEYTKYLNEKTDIGVTYYITDNHIYIRQKGPDQE